MQPAAEAQNSLSLERKLKLHEARESIIGRLASNLPTSINLDSFLQVIVAELGQMMEVDRCDIIKLTPDGELSVSHEWRASDNVPSSVEMRIPMDVETLSQHLDVRKPIKLDDTSAPDLDHKIRFFAKSLGTRSLLVVPVVLDDEVLGLIGLHHTRTTRHWFDEEVAFLVSIATQLAIGYQYTRIYTDKKREAETTNALLEIANSLNARSDFGAVTSAGRIVGYAVGWRGCIWREPRDRLKDGEVAVCEGIADQPGTALARDHLSAEMMRLKSALHEPCGEDRIIAQAVAIRRAIELGL